jgi:hypothetical protein
MISNAGKMIIFDVYPPCLKREFLRIIILYKPLPRLPPAGYFFWLDPKKVTKKRSSFARKTPRFARQTVRAKRFHRVAARLVGRSGRWSSFADKYIIFYDKIIQIV